MDKKKITKKLDAQELEKRKAPFASPIMSTEGGEAAEGGGFESGGTRRAPEPDTAPQTTGPLRKTPIVYRSE
jgi:hypothetical protein